jgi:hypothetical protein
VHGHVVTYFGAWGKSTRTVQPSGKLQLANFHVPIDKFQAFISYTEAKKVPWLQVSLDAQNTKYKSMFTIKTYSDEGK